MPRLHLQLDPLVTLVEMLGDTVQGGDHRSDTQGYADINRTALAPQRGLQRQTE